MNPLPLQRRLILFCSLTFAILLTVVGTASYRFLVQQLDVDASADLDELTTGLHGYVQFEEGQPAIVFDDKDDDEAAFVHRAARYYQIYDAGDGGLITESDGMAPLGLHLTPDQVRAFLAHPALHDVQTAYGRFRFSSSAVSSSSGNRFLLRVGASLDPMDAARRRYLELLLALALPTLLVMFVAVQWMASRALAPLNALATQARGVNIDTLDRRLPVRGAGDQLDEVTIAFNDTLSNLEGAVGEMRQFSSALAHELRTPLAALRGEIELSLLQPRSDEEWRARAASQIEEIDKLTRLVNQLLTLARAEAGEIPVARDPVDLTALATSVADQLEAVALANDVTLRSVATSAIRIVGDRQWLERLLLNLLDNAMKYTPAGGDICVTVSQDAAGARVDVADTGIGIPAEALPHVFDRFYRVDPSRSSAVEGAGLGLSLSKWIVDRHRGQISVQSEPGRGSLFTVRLPLPAIH